MTDPRLSRRKFLMGMGAGAGAVLLGAACSDGGHAKSSLPKKTKATISEEHDKLPPGTKGVQGYLATSTLRVGENRFAFGVVVDGKLLRDAPVRVGFAPQGGTPSGLVSAPFHGVGLPNDKGVYVTSARFDRPGTWEATIETGGTQGKTAFQVVATSLIPAPGMAAPRAASPTKSETLGVDPICTRDPECPLHEVSLAKVIGAGKPVAVMFATPARCTSLVCGPVLDELLGLVGRYQGKIEFIHVEIYRNNASNELLPTLEAWNLETEPWLFGINGAGTIMASLEGAFDTAEISRLLDSLVA